MSEAAIYGYEDPDEANEKANKAKQQLTHETFLKYDENNDGSLNRCELRKAVSEITGDSSIDVNHVEALLDEFDKDKNGEIDYSEFQVLYQYLTNEPTKNGRKSKELSFALSELAHLLDESDDEDDSDVDDFLENGVLNAKKWQRRVSRVSFASEVTARSSLSSTPTPKRKSFSSIVAKAVKKSQRENEKHLKKTVQKLFPVKEMLCVQNANFDNTITMHESREMDFDDLLHESFSGLHNPMDPDFESAFPPSAMRCLALVSHNGMKKTMREFVTANKNLLKKFRLTGTNSTMTMLKEVFKEEEPGTVMFGPSCASGPLGGDAELVAHMVSGKIGGVVFFQDPMDSHPHRADIDCLVRQALVHNTMMAETPTSALMMLECLRTALMDKRAELIPSFFFSLQSPTVEQYKSQQKAVVDKQRENVRLSRMSCMH